MNKAQPPAYLTGKPIDEVPEGLYIHPDALKVILEEFSGPLDLLLYLIRRHNIDIAVINIAQIANQYLEYVRLMKEFNIQLAAEYLVMASILAELKSRALLPANEEEKKEGEAASSALVAKIKEYEKIRDKAEELEKMPRLERDFFIPSIRYAMPPPSPMMLPSKEELAEMFKRVLIHRKLRRNYAVNLEELSTRERMSKILDKLAIAKQLDTLMVPFEDLFSKREGKGGVAVALLALTQLLKERLVDATQSSPYSRIFVFSPEEFSAENEVDREKEEEH